MAMENWTEAELAELKELATPFIDELKGIKLDDGKTAYNKVIDIIFTKSKLSGVQFINNQIKCGLKVSKGIVDYLYETEIKPLES